MAVFMVDDQPGVGTSMFFLRYLLETIAEIKHENDSLRNIIEDDLENAESVFHVEKLSDEDRKDFIDAMITIKRLYMEEKSGISAECVRYYKDTVFAIADRLGIKAYTH